MLIGDNVLRDEQDNRWFKESRPPPTTTTPSVIAPATTPSTTGDTQEQQTSLPDSNNPVTPEDVVKAYMDALIGMDYETLKTLMSAASLADFPSKQEFEEQFTSEETRWFIQNFIEFRATKVEIQNNTAMVEGIFYFKQNSSVYPDGTDPSVLFYLVKENGKWRIDK
jgi:ABC-type transporter MlaC component